MTAAADRRTVVRNGLGVGLAVGLYGAAFGAAGTAAGLTVAQTCVLSLVMFTGASQFALVGVLGAGGGAAAAVASALLLGSRNTLYALRLSTGLAWRGWRRLLGAHLVIDESTAMAVAAPPVHLRSAFVTTGAAVLVGWNVTTLLGALGSDLLVGGPAAAALDAVVPAAFLALVWPRLRADAANRRVALGGALIALLLTPVVTPGVQVLLATFAVVLGLRGTPPAGPAPAGPRDRPGESSGAAP